MTLELMAYTTAVSLLVGLAALMIERAIGASTWPRRWLWAIAMTMSLGGSAWMVLSAHQQPPKRLDRPRAVSAAPQQQVQQFMPVADLHPARPSHGLQVAPVAEALEVPLKWTWVGASLVLLCAYALGAWRLRRARRGWRALRVNGIALLVADEVGPAVVGFHRPVIVVPQWLVDGSAATRDIALAHEQEHIAVRDPVLLLFALLLLMLTPWNLPLWWQLRRMKLAIEVDCDRRVLHRGIDPKQYGYSLLQINQQMGRMPMAAIAIVGGVSQIERRIAIMVAKRPGNVGLWIAGWVAAAIPLLVVAAQINPPSSAPELVADTPHALLGIGVADFDVNGAARAIAARHPGALVMSVHPGGAADRAGLKRGDVILKLGDTTVSGMTDLVTALTHISPEASVSLSVLRAGAMQTPSVVTVHFSPVPAESPQAPAKIIDASDWDALRDASLPIGNPKLRAELIKISGLDQLQATMHTGLTEKMPLAPDTSVIIPSHMDSGTAANVRRLKAVIAQYGWPTVSMVGIRGAHAAALIVLGAKDPKFQAEALALLEPLVQRDEASVSDYARIYDQVHTPQRYGSQMACENGLSKPSKPIEDPAHLDDRRSALGLIKLPKFCRISS